MSSKAILGFLGLAAVGAMAVGAAQAEPRLVSMKADAMHGNASLYKYVGGPPKFVPKLPVSDSATVPLGVSTFIDGWALIDQTNCVQLGVPEPFTIRADKDDKITYTSALISAPLGSGACPGMNFTFSGISATWGGKGGGGVSHVNTYAATTMHIKQNAFGLPPRAKIVDTITLTLQ